MVRTAQTHRSKPRKSKPMNDLIPIKGQRKVILGELTSPIEKGDIIFSTTPIFPTLISELLSSHCSGCLKTAQQISEDSNIDIDKVEERMLKCSRCQVHVFCSVKCYASTWCSLNDECRGLANNPGWIPNTIARLVAKVLSSRRFGREVGSKKSLMDRIALKLITITQLYDPLPDYPDTNFTHVNEETLKIHDSVIQLLAQPKYEGETLIYTVQFCQYHIDEDDGFETLMGRVCTIIAPSYLRSLPYAVLCGALMLCPEDLLMPVDVVRHISKSRRYGTIPQFIEDSPLLQT
ncbi:hypothetical protein L486_00599 [Kwoniella mangroviensis CBS 10435]|uniref:MYND-type domain-containing protein n=1 Tax=Kwoniella mangroviensis CBS 10435 TaxID=1331196 RepID=A0A1B9IZJ0_9TREE|nr:hypothetical protein L486_00599 [Kwoniella mangroviensis CBS 10435]